MKITTGAGVAVGSGVGMDGVGGAWMAMGGGVGLRQRKVNTPSRMALISAPASAEFQCQRTTLLLGDVVAGVGDLAVGGGLGAAVMVILHLCVTGESSLAECG